MPRKNKASSSLVPDATRSTFAIEIPLDATPEKLTEEIDTIYSEADRLGNIRDLIRDRLHELRQDSEAVTSTRCAQVDALLSRDRTVRARLWQLERDAIMRIRQLDILRVDEEILSDIKKLVSPAQHKRLTKKLRELRACLCRETRCRKTPHQEKAE